MTVLQKAKLKLAKMLNIEFAQTQTDKGILEHDADSIAVGEAVYAEDENGDAAPAPDGEYTDEQTGAVYVVQDGVVTEIVEADEKEMASGKKAKKAGKSDEGKTMNRARMEGEQEPAAGASAEDFGELLEVVNSLVAEVETLKAEMEEVKAESGQVQKENNEMRKALRMSVDVPASAKDKTASKKRENNTDRFFNGWKNK